MRIAPLAMVALCAELSHGQTCMWTGTQPMPPLPSPRSGAALAYDPVRQRVVMFGGQGEAGMMSDTFEWDGANWMLRATTGPTARSRAAMAYHPALGKTLMFGGTVQGGPATPRTWMWNGAAWTDVGTNSDLQPSIASMAWDASQSRMLLIADNNSPNARMWEFNTTTNTWVATSNAGPGSGYGYAMAYDTARAKMVVYGGKMGSASQWCGSLAEREREPGPIAVRGRRDGTAWGWHLIPCGAGRCCSGVGVRPALTRWERLGNATGTRG